MIQTPFFEILTHVELAKAKDQNERWNNFMDTFYATQENLKKGDRQKYVDVIKPKEKAKGITPPKTTDLDMLRRKKAGQTGGSR